MLDVIVLMLKSFNKPLLIVSQTSGPMSHKNVLIKYSWRRSFEMLDPFRGLAKKLLVAFVNDVIAWSISFSSAGSRHGPDRNSLTSMLISGSNQGRCIHRVESRLVLAAIRELSLLKIDSKISSVSVLSLSSPSSCCSINYGSIIKLPTDWTQKSQT